MNYTIYHMHSMLSNPTAGIDSVTDYNEYVSRAKELGMTALGISEHGNAFAWYDKQQAIEKAGMKYIYVVEAYMTESLKEKVKDNYHIILIAKNMDGVKEINKMVSHSFNRLDGHFYGKPRITVDELFATSDNVLITTACLGGPLAHMSEESKITFINWMVEHKDRCYLEIQHHDDEDQIMYNRCMWKLSQTTGIPLIAGTDTHSLTQDQARGRLMLQKAKDYKFPEEDHFDMVFKTYDELCEAYRMQAALPESVWMNAIEETNRMADRIEGFEFDRKTKYPHIYDNSEEIFKQKINEAFKKHPYVLKNNKSQDVIQRVREEFEVYKKVGAIDFMLLETYLREWEVQNDICSGPGRGSVSGSIIAYLLNITKMDSLRFNLNFFRFMNPSRVTNADIDTDYYEKDREKIKRFILRDKMNLPNIRASEIITFNTVATKGAIKDICRAMSIPLTESQRLSDAVVDDVIPDSVRKQYPQLCEYVDIITGTVVSIGSHPSGVLVSDKDIESDVGLCSLSTSDYPVSMLDMHSLDALMYVKLDLLGLDNLGVINETCKLAGIDILTPDNTDLNDENVWKSIREDTTLIFQWESESAQAYLKKFMSDDIIAIAKEHNPDFSWIKWLSFGNGLIRPGCASFRDDIAEGHINVTGFKELDDFLALTFGRITMQEDIMRFCKMFCGYNDAESDNVRRAIAKKKGTETLLGELHDRFISYSSETYGVETSLLETIFPPIRQGILDASEYAFSWNHSDAYSCIGYISGYLRYYYPLEFLTASLNIFTDKNEKTVAITNYANRVGVKIAPIQFRHSGAEYMADKTENKIYKGIASIKYMNRQLGEDMYAMRNEKFDSFFDVLDRFTGDTRQREALIQLDFFKEFGKSQKLLTLANLYDEYQIKGKTKTVKKDTITDDSIITAEMLNQYCVKQSDKQYSIDKEGARKILLMAADKIPNTSIPYQDKVKAEIAYLGYVQSIMPQAIGNAIVLDIDCKYSPKVTYVTLDTGEVKTAKISKQMFVNIPLVVGDMIKYRTEERPQAYKDTEGKWQTDPTKTSTWFAWYGSYT